MAAWAKFKKLIKHHDSFFTLLELSTKDLMCPLRTTSNLMHSEIRCCDKLLKNKGCLIAAHHRKTRKTFMKFFCCCDSEEREKFLVYLSLFM
jgi:hypothetical protein